jgi:hypothetical protein
MKARLACNQRLKQRFALDERKVRDVPTFEMQEIGSVIDQVHATLAVGRRLCLGKGR